MTNGWTQERKARQAILIQTWRPWEQSTGPKTLNGKVLISRNAYKGGARPVMRELSRLLRKQEQQEEPHLGSVLTLSNDWSMSAFSPISDSLQNWGNVRFVPLADLCVSITFSSACTKARHRFIVVVFAVFAVGLGYPAQADILIGAAGSMTGRDAWLGDQMERDAELAVADINAAGGALGQPVQLVIADDFCDPEQGVAAAQELIGDGVVFVVGHYCSGSSIPASKLYEAAGVLQISPASTNPLLTEQGRDNVFRVIGRDDAQGIVAGNYLADQLGSLVTANTNATGRYRARW
jgi:hypothetical protein